MKNSICVLGDGAWGTTIAQVLALNGHTVTLWCYNADVAESINKQHRNSRFLPHIDLSDRITATTQLETAVSNVQIIFEAVPVLFLRSVLQQAQPFVNKNQQWVVLSKGIEQKTLLLPSQIIESVTGVSADGIAVCSGPSFAHELIQQQPTALLVASNNPTVGEAVSRLLQNDYISTQASRDMLGVQLVAACKNVLALGCGILQGAGYGQNTQAFFLTRGLQEITRLAHHMGGQPETIYGIAGIGDIMLTAYSQNSKNTAWGILLGQGHAVAQIRQEKGTAPEGVNTAVSLHQLMAQRNCSLPLCEAVYQIVWEQKSPTLLIDRLMGC